MGSGHVVGRRRPPVKAAMPAPGLSGLVLSELRAYRVTLGAEEDRVSYWRRLVQGRVDLLEAQANSQEALSLTDLVRVLGDTGSGRSRRALIRVTAPTQLPTLPDLDEMCRLWAVDTQDAAEVTQLIDRLRAVESTLSSYRNALHERIDAATGELIIRYRADPRAALDLLPSE